MATFAHMSGSWRELRERRDQLGLWGELYHQVTLQHQVFLLTGELKKQIVTAEERTIQQRS